MINSNDNGPDRTKSSKICVRIVSYLLNSSIALLLLRTKGLLVRMCRTNAGRGGMSIENQVVSQYKINLNQIVI